ncbi:hypothetical protein EDB81DRAFT_161307 [Dactylonectria macrodidyma]|uniref:Uncharacterized protein n=1 Tax=Dactylonectria macrodidyma TaxID=307937 RepID=A0A9P9FPN7_9HYPO|nr:hypothetical protein EDB81DRAFT_161307 [Dactylonectria macrodidyma]
MLAMTTMMAGLVLMMAGAYALLPCLYFVDFWLRRGQDEPKTAPVMTMGGAMANMDFLSPPVALLLRPSSFITALSSNKHLRPTSRSYVVKWAASNTCRWCNAMYFVRTYSAHRPRHIPGSASIVRLCFLCCYPLQL